MATYSKDLSVIYLQNDKFNSSNSAALTNGYNASSVTEASLWAALNFFIPSFYIKNYLIPLEVKFLQLDISIPFNY